MPQSCDDPNHVCKGLLVTHNGFRDESPAIHSISFRFFPPAGFSKPGPFFRAKVRSLFQSYLSILTTKVLSSFPGVKVFQGMGINFSPIPEINGRKNKTLDKSISCSKLIRISVGGVKASHSKTWLVKYMIKIEGGMFVWLEHSPWLDLTALCWDKRSCAGLRLTEGMRTRYASEMLK